LLIVLFDPLWIKANESFEPPSEGISAPLVFDDMEHGNLFENGWFVFGGAVGGGGIGSNMTDLPPSDGGSFSIETGWGSGGVPGFYGGFGRTFLLEFADMTHFTFWINPDAEQDYTLEINLQEDDNGNNGMAIPDDDEFQYNFVVSPTGPGAISGGGWQRITIPLTDFFDDNSFYANGNGVFDPVAVGNGGNGQLVNVVIAVIGNSGSDVTFRTDYWAFLASGACCLSAETCSFLPECECVESGGEYLGDNILCPNPQEYYADMDRDGYSDGTTMIFACDPGDDYKLIGELLGDGDDDCNDDDSNLTFIGAPCEDGDPNTVEDFVNGDCECVRGYIIPTLGQWSIMFLALVMLILGTLVVRRKVSSA
jgi:hypothetical protein